MGINVTCDHTLEELYDNKYFCPGNFTNCEELSGTSTVRSIFLGIKPTYVSLVSCSFSVLGSLLIVFSYWRWKDIRTGSHTVVTWLAIADMFTAGGYILGSANFIKYYGLPSGTFACVHFQQICKIQSFLTTWSSMSSFVWTAYLAIYIYLTLVRGRIILANRLIPLVHVIAWIGPFFIAYPLLIVKKLGLSRVSSSNWCFVSVLNNELEGTELHAKVFLLTLWAGKLWELVTYVLVVVLYVLVKCHIRKETKQAKTFVNGDVLKVAHNVDRKITLIPLVFFLLRIWGTLQFVYILIDFVLDDIKCGCIAYSGHVGLLFLGYTQAIGDGGQGWGNAILYIFLSAKLRGRLFGWLYRPLINCCLVAVGRYKHRGGVNSTAPLVHQQRHRDLTKAATWQPGHLAASAESGSAYLVPEGGGQSGRRRNGGHQVEIEFEQTTEFSHN